METVGPLSVAVVFGWIADFVSQLMAEVRDRRRYPPPGRMVDIGARRIHMVTVGTGRPVVIIIPAIGGTTLEWMHVQRAAAAETTVCVYDRPGTGWSDQVQSGSLTPDAMAADLSALLAAADLTPPYILAGHSFGGIVARRFWACHPDWVAGMLMIDSSHEGQASRLPAPRRREAAESRLERFRWWQASILGLRRLAIKARLLNLDAEIARVSLPMYAPEALAIALSSRHQQAVARETALLTETWGSPPNLGSLPLIVLTSANRPWDGYPAWVQMQDELAALSSNSQHVTAHKGGHQIHLDDPDLVIQSVSLLLNRVGSSK